MSIDLFEVITHREGRAFGQTFTRAETAQAYADAMRAAGYTVDPFPPFETVDSAADALRRAADLYGDGRLDPASPANRGKPSRFVVVERSAETGAALAYYHGAQSGAWTEDFTLALRLHQSEAEDLAHDWTDWATSKGRGTRYAAERVESEAAP